MKIGKNILHMYSYISKKIPALFLHTRANLNARILWRLQYVGGQILLLKNSRAVLNANWDLVVSDHNLNECTDVTLDYIRLCENICVPIKDVTIYTNQKPWFASCLESKLHTREEAFQSADQQLFKAAKYEFRKAVIDDKRNSRDKLENDSSSNDSWEV